jgi:hypothetical protein
VRIEGHELGVLERGREGCSRAFVREGSIKDKDKTSTMRELVQPEPGACVCATQENQGFHALHTDRPLATDILSAAKEGVVDMRS